mmetsp:Transcript_26815/g.58466  ORF Transcript_26815/g.58466 Transcript_26815/m.58466 type:complete len:224 (-) Transcript_26815:278-949(-)
MTSRESSSLATNRWLALGAICMANFLTLSLKVAENRSSWTLGFFLRILLMRRTESSANASALSISSASSNTRMATSSRLRMRLEAHALSLPWVPITTCSVMGSFLKADPSCSEAVEVALIPVNLAMRVRTLRFCITSSRVGHMQSAWGTRLVGSTLLSMDRTKHVVLPLPLCACAIRSLWGGVKIMGRVIACTRDGRSNFISTYNPCFSSSVRGSSSKVAAEE